VRADSQIIRQEAREVLQRAMVTYPGDPIHVALYIAHIILPWNDLLTKLSRIDSVTSDPKKVKRIVTEVDHHLDSELRSYLGIGPSK